MSDTKNGQPACELCGEPMPPGEEMFRFHGYSGPCPKPSTSPERCETHRWTTVRAGGDPAEATSAERVTVCADCGIERTDENATKPCVESKKEGR